MTGRRERRQKRQIHPLDLERLGARNIIFPMLFRRDKLYVRFGTLPAWRSKFRSITSMRIFSYSTTESRHHFSAGDIQCPAATIARPVAAQ
jgi:hypothetical protein